MLNFLPVIVILVLSFSFVDAKVLTNKEWVKKENLTKPIALNINGKKLDLDKDIEEITKYYQNKPYDYFFLPQKKVINDKEKECAQNIKNDIYMLRLDRHKPTKLPHNLTWSENPFNDRNWEFLFHNWQFTDCLLDGYTMFKDSWYLQRMKWLVSDWWIDNFKEEYPSKEFSWYDHTIPFRLHNMLKIFEFLRRNDALDSDFTKVALRSIYWHARIISEERSLYIKNHNHGLDQSMRLFEASQLFPEFSLSQSWEEVSKKRLANEVNFALTTKGIHKENSPGYHTWVSLLCAEINDFSKHYTGTSISKVDGKALQEGGLKFLTTISRPDGTLPQIGDTSPNRNIDVHYPLQEKLSWYPYYQYIKSNGQSGEKPQETTTIFKESGYFIYRDKWDNPGENSAMHLILKCGFLAKAHRHNDDGNILLYGLGEDWLIDAGMYGYKYDQYRSYAVSPSAHNISFPYNIKLSHLGSKNIISLDERLSMYKDNWGIIESSKTHAVCESHIFKGYTYKRALEITGKRSFKLSDKLTPDNNKSNDIYMTLFKVPDDKDIYINTDERTVLVLNAAKDSALRIHYLNDLSKIILFRGEKGVIKSLETVGWLKMRPAKTIAFIDKNTSYSAQFELELISAPVLKGFKKMSINHDGILKDFEAEVSIQKNTDEVIFNLFPIQAKANLKVSFYLYKDGVRIDRQRYSKNFTYRLNKKKFGSGKYRIKYFIIKDKIGNHSKKEEKEIGYSKYITID